MLNRLRIKDFPPGESPYDKIEKYGSGMLSNAELLAIIIRTGSRDETSLDIARRIIYVSASGSQRDNGAARVPLPEFMGLGRLKDLSLEQLTQISGVGKVKAFQIMSLAEAAKRMNSMRGGAAGTYSVSAPEAIAALMMDEMSVLPKEIFRVLLLDAGNRIIRYCDISVGSADASIAHPREVFTEAVKAGCSSVIMVHNHPAGDPEPSAEDIAVTERLLKAGEILGIEVLDHLIIGNGSFTSMRRRGLSGFRRGRQPRTGACFCLN